VKLALLGPVAWRTPPRAYGPWEQVVSMLAEGLVARGVDVTLFATLDSLTSARLDGVCPLPYNEEPALDGRVSEALHVGYFLERSDQFDLVHNHVDWLPLAMSRLCRTRMVTTIHGFGDGRTLPAYVSAASAFVSISDADRVPELTYLATVHHGVEELDWPLCASPGDELVSFGRIHPDKANADAIEIARRLGRRLIMLHPLGFDEPFGLSVIEAMMCGTPVVGYRRGALPETIDDGLTGFLVNDVDGAVAAVPRAVTLNRTRVGAVARRRFSAARMVDDYLAVYDRMLFEPHR
jgi:glycosyltransferase involved in cell wall biosynthesis